MRLLLKICVFAASVPWMVWDAYGSESAASMLTIEHVNGTQSHYSLGDAPVLTIEGSLLRLKSAKAETTFNRSDVLHFHFTESTLSAIDDVSDDGYSVSVTDGMVKVSGLQAGCVDVYDINGRHVSNVMVADGCAEVNIGVLSRRVYVLRIPGKPSLKVLNK